jgi:hypothetical protein
VSSEGTEACSRALAAIDNSSSRTADLQPYSNSQRKKRPALVLLYRTGELTQPAQQAAHQNFIVEPSLAVRAPAHTTAAAPV